MTAAERGFHKALTALRQLQKDRWHRSQHTQQYSAVAEARWAEAVMYDGADPNDTELRDLMAADEDCHRAQSLEISAK